MKMKKNLSDYELLWEKITDYAKATGRTTARPVLLLYYGDIYFYIFDRYDFLLSLSYRLPV